MNPILMPNSDVPDVVQSAYATRHGRPAAGDWWYHTGRNAYAHSANGTRLDFHALATGTEPDRKTREDLNSAFLKSLNAEYARKPRRPADTPAQAPSGAVAAPVAVIRLPWHVTALLALITVCAVVSMGLLVATVGSYGPSYDRECCAVKIGVPERGF